MSDIFQVTAGTFIENATTGDFQYKTDSILPKGISSCARRLTDKTRTVNLERRRNARRLDCSLPLAA
jgi:hypothetical protein